MREMRGISCPNSFSHRMDTYSKDLLLFILIMSLFSFIPYNPSIVTKEDDENSISKIARLLAIGIAILSSYVCWVFVSELILILTSSNEEQEQRGGGGEEEDDLEFYTLNFDGCDVPQLNNGGAGCIIRDNQGDLVIASAYNLSDYYPNCNVAIVEALALRNGLRLAKRYNIRLDRIEGDSQEIVGLVQGLGRERRRKRSLESVVLDKIMEDIRDSLHEQSIDPKLSVLQIPREANRVADKLATLGCQLRFEQEKVYRRHEQDIPSQLGSLIKQDKNTLVRL